MFALVLALLSICSTARAACPEQEAWAKGCDTDGFSFEIESCSDATIVGSARLNGGPELPIELKRATDSSFRRVDGTGVQPIGEFADWNRQPASHRDTLDAMLRCVERIGAPPLSGTIKRARGDDEEHASPRLLLLGLLLLGGTLFIRTSLSVTSPAQRRRDGLLLGAFSLFVAWARWQLVKPATFHQNGQGPLWVGMARDNSAHGSVYGPGYAEVFGWLASRMDPEQAVFLINGALFTLMIPAAFSIARSAGLGRVPAWLVVAALAVHPLAARLAGGESYFAAISGLGMLACLAMVAAAQPEHALSAPRRRWLFLMGSLAAGVLIAQAARIHPMGWTPLAVTPVAILALRGPLRTRVLRSVVLSSCVAVLVVATSLAEMLKVLAGELGQLWLPRVRFSWVESSHALTLFPVMWLIAGLRRGALLPALGFCLVLGLALGNNPLRPASHLIAHAVYWLYLPALLGAFVGWLTRLGSLQRAVSGACVVGLVFGFGWENRKSYLTLPTDALEIRHANRWKRELPVGANVAYVNRVDDRVLFLPLYDTSQVGSMTLTSNLRTMRSVPDLYYYRSSLCSVPQGKTLCDRFESQLVLTPVYEASLPAIPSLRYLPLGPDPIRVSLFKARLKSSVP